MRDMTTIEARLTRAGLDPEQVQAAVQANAADLDGFQQWLDSVSDPDIKAKFGGTDGEAAAASDEGTAGDDGKRTGRRSN